MKPFWNYRVMKRHYRIRVGGRRVQETLYGLYEVHYDGRGRVRSWAEKPIEEFPTLDQLRSAFVRMYAACYKFPVLDHNHLEKKHNGHSNSPHRRSRKTD
jgi:hypothetical protein